MRIGKSNKNQGFSLIELVVVIAILAIVVGISGLSISVLTGKKVKKCADELVSVIENARVMTLGKEQNAVECIIYKEADGSYYAKILQGGTEAALRKIGEEPIEIKVYFDNEGTSYQLDSIAGNNSGGAASAGAGLHIVFNRSSGAFVEKTTTAGGVKEYCTGIEVTSGSRTVSVSLVGKTGKIVKN